MNLINTLLYFAVFKYPLTQEELLDFCQYETNSIKADLELLLESKKIYKIGEFYLPCNNKDWVERRLAGNEMAFKLIKKAKRMAKILSQFPFVKSVMISGTLAKGYMDKDADIDFFVIMKPGNIIISKLWMGIFRRLFAPKSFCVNYLIDTKNMLIQKQNIYSATEMVTLIPLIDDQGIYDVFVDLNKDWIKDYLPNAKMRINNAESMKHGHLKYMLERMLSLSLSTKFNSFLKRYYLNSLGKGNEVKERSLKTEELVVKEGVFKGHDLSYQSTILELYNKNLRNFSTNLKWNSTKYFYD